MCGIFGWIPPSPRQFAELPDVVARQFAALAHRGPDDRGWAAFGADGARVNEAGEAGRVWSLLLGQTRLAIIDLSAAGHQPMLSADGRYALVYNGEIYNYLELRAELEQAGMRFRGHTDSEVLLEALIRWGKQALPRLNGMFAFALYDVREQSVFFARDAFGIKPLYYHQGAAGLAFASELPALLEFPDVPRRLAPQQVYNYLCFGRYDRGGETFFRNIRQLPPGHCMRVGIGGLAAEPECWWKPDLDRRSGLSFVDAAACLRELFLDSVRLHLRSDVPLGVALSGGIDSSAVTCAVRHLEPETELHTFSFIARGSALSEEHWAEMVAAHTRAIRHTVTVAPEELVRDLDAMIRHQGEPFVSTSIYAQYRVFQLAREAGIKVTLDGQGADELLAGYQGYPGQRLASLIGRGDLAGAARFLRAKSAWPDCSGLDIALRGLREFTPDWLVPLGLKIVGRNPAPDWLDVAQLRALGVALRLPDERQARYPHADKVRQILAYQLTWDGLPQLLRHGDRNAMAASVESRVPFLTRSMAEFCLSLPEEYLIDMNGRSKSVFREAMRGIVPDPILDRRDKIGFATPEADWLRALAPWVETTLGTAENIPYLNLDAARREWQAMRAGKAVDWRVWRWLNYVRWVQMFKVEA